MSVDLRSIMEEKLARQKGGFQFSDHIVTLLFRRTLFASVTPIFPDLCGLSVQGLKKRHGGIAAVREVSFQVAPGEIFGLIGPNGAGKSTTLECILGLCEPDAGSIMFGEIDVRSQPAKAKEKIGAQLQVSALPDVMTPRQSLKLCASFYPHAARPEDLLARFDLAEKADARFSSLSGGQRQRLALALAFVNKPELVILDEPTAGLDPPARRELHRLIMAQRSEGTTVVFTTHYLEEARTLCDRVALIDRGALVALDTPEVLIARCGMVPKIMFRTARTLDEPAVLALSGVIRAVPAGDDRGWRLETSEVNRTITALGALVDARRDELLELQIQRPTLDDVFFELTGRATATAREVQSEPGIFPNP
jgi:ABC-2 type transport system ATP-binding protein